MKLSAFRTQACLRERASRADIDEAKPRTVRVLIFAIEPLPTTPTLKAQLDAHLEEIKASSRMRDLMRKAFGKWGLAEIHAISEGLLELTLNAAQPGRPVPGFATSGLVIL